MLLDHLIKILLVRLRFRPRHLERVNPADEMLLHRRERLRESMVQMNVAIEESRDELRVSFLELKKYEIAQENILLQNQRETNVPNIAYLYYNASSNTVQYQHPTRDFRHQVCVYQ